MSYSIAKAKLVADQLSRLATQHAHQLAGQLSNLEFWMVEAASAIAVIDDYPARFRKLRDAQVAWVRSRDVKVPFFCPLCQGECEFSPATPGAPQRIPCGRPPPSCCCVFIGRAFFHQSDLNRHASDLELPIEPEDLREDTNKPERAS